MKRPGLQQLLKDIGAGRVDVVVVYKVDRLTRSLANFAKMVDVFDGAGVSFVSVTQAFNTTSSMGRLTLNVLLSFAQFEREVTAERIRDKVAASKRKGMWMGGAIPLGYNVVDKALVANQHEAAAIQTIFAEDLSQSSVRQLSVWLHALGVVSKVRHKEQLHEGLHEAIIDNATWKQVQIQLADHGGKTISAVRRPAKRPLDGVLFDSIGRAMRTTYASKSAHTDGTTRTKRYWYYTSVPSGSENRTEIERLPADEIERVVMKGLEERLLDANWLADQNGRAKPIVIVGKDAPQQDPDLITLVADARRWAGELIEGKASSVLEITDREGLRSGSVSCILPLAWLAPDISTAILEGRQPPHLTAKTLRALPELPLEWVEQRQILGFA